MKSSLESKMLFLTDIVCFALVGGALMAGMILAAVLFLAL